MKHETISVQVMFVLDPHAIGDVKRYNHPPT